MQALAAAIKYLELLSTDRNFNSFEMSLYDIHQYMKLDVGAAKALNVEACPGDSRTAYLQGVLNQCRTPQGRRLLNQWIKQPLINLQHIGKSTSQYHV
jgi:DNA mismatch repair protein MSH2